MRYFIKRTHGCGVAGLNIYVPQIHVLKLSPPSVIRRWGLQEVISVR